MDSMVTARVPEALKRETAEKLKAVDATFTQLVNAACEYVVQTGRLPAASKGLAKGRKVKRVLTPEQQEMLKASLERMYVGELDLGGKTFKETLMEAKLERFA